MQGKYKRSNSHKAKTSNTLKGHIVSDGTRKKISNSLKGRFRKEKSPSWKNGISYNKDMTSWQKNKRNRVIKRLRIESLSHSYGEWEILKKQYGFTCPCCKRSEPDIKLTEDHIIPLSKGGSDLIENIQPLCLKCNLQKATKIIRYVGKRMDKTT